MSKLGKIGIIGGTGWLGSAMLKQMLAKKFVTEKDLWVANRSGKRLQLEAWPQVHVTNKTQDLVNHCDTIILSVRPQDFLALKIKLDKHVVISVMAGVHVKRIQEVVAGKYIVRAMPNAAAEIGESYTPWFCERELDADRAAAVQKLFETMGMADRVTNEDDINFFTALTGSGQGWVAFMEQSLIQCAQSQGIPHAIAERAVRQLFLGMGKLLAQSDVSIEELIKVLIDYAGTTAAGLIVMKNSTITKEVEKAILASYKKANSDMTA